jgi:hypothetical protein
METSSQHRFFLLMVSFALIANSCDDRDIKCCQCIEDNGESDAYIYPLTPESPEWASLSSGEEMYQVCQIPTGTLRNMCTVGLVDSWLTYPLLFNLFAWLTPQAGIDRLRDNFNGLNELLNRRDVGGKLLAKYKQVDPSGYNPDWSNADKGKYSISLFVLELTLAQKQSLEFLTSIEIVELMTEAIKKRDSKETDSIYEPLSDISDVYIMARVMIHQKYEPFLLLVDNDPEIKFFSDSCVYGYVEGTDPSEDLDQIVMYAKNYLIQ